MYNGYDFYFKIDGNLITLPITPATLNIKTESNNKTVTLINEGEINILKSPSLTEIEFEAIIPARKYPFSREPYNIDYYINIFEKVLENKKPFNFSVVRATPTGKTSWGSTFTVSLEGFEIEEDAEENQDVLLSFHLKQYKTYGKVEQKILTSTPTTTSTSEKPREDTNNSSEMKEYTVKPGDCLWNISKAFYENGADWNKIYEANKNVIESTAKEHRNGKGSSNGHWIYPGTKLVIPAK